MQFNYKQHNPDYATLLADRSMLLMREMIDPGYDSIAKCSDTRPTHGFLFESLTPQGHEYFAGHYRGENFNSLRTYNVCFGTWLGANYSIVLVNMESFRTLIRSGLRQITGEMGNWTTKVLAANLTLFLARIFSSFISIHPYADGNGHIARFLVCAASIPKGFVPREWTIHPRPIDDVRYREAYKEYREGREEMLLKLIGEWFEYDSEEPRCLL